jgi:hypothetical protein
LSYLAFLIARTRVESGLDRFEVVMVLKMSMLVFRVINTVLEECTACIFRAKVRVKWVIHVGLGESAG